jgi:hypothetical protein
MESRPVFKRMVLGLPHSAKDYVSVAFTAELADMLGLELVAVFAEDEGLIDLALLPCVREFRVSGDGWHRLDAEQLVRSSNQAVTDARRHFGDAARSLRVATRFDLVKGQIEKVVGALTNPEDIIVVIEPKSALERVSHQFMRFVEMALSAPTAALLVPSQIRRRKGPVVAIAANQHDVSIQVGLRMAERVREKLLVLAPKDVDEAQMARLRTTTAVHVALRSLTMTEAGSAGLEPILAANGARLIVTSPSPDSLFPFRLASERGVPVLVTARSESLRRSVD